MTPEARLAFLDSLAFGLPIPRALSGAYDGRIPVKAWRELGEMRRAGGPGYDAEVAGACERAEAGKEASDDRAKQGGEVVATAADVGAARGRSHTGSALPPVGAGGDGGGRGAGGGGREAGEGEEEGEGEARAVELGGVEESTGSRAVVGVNPFAALMAEPWAPPSLTPTLYDHLDALDAKCVAIGRPPLSPWWRWSFSQFLASLKPWGIFLVGRGGGKSTSLELLAAALARYGTRVVPPGQTWTMPFISVGPDDANRRINGIASCFRADGLAIVGEENEDGKKVKAGEGVKIARAPRGSLELVDVAGNDIQLASIAGTIGNVSGPSTFGLMIDEAAKLLDRATGANPLTEIVASAAQTSRGRAGWLAIICSSAWEESGAHYGMVTAPPNDVAHVATIGADFLDAALAGFESVAAWEQRRGDLDAARRIREHAASLRADSPLVPTWVPNPTIGNREGPFAWDGAALATRMLVEVLPESALDGIPRILYWLRENGSKPLERGESGANAAAQCLLAARITRQVNAARNGRRVPVDVGLMTVPGAPVGDPRYAGPVSGRRPMPGGMGKRRVF